MFSALNSTNKEKEFMAMFFISHSSKDATIVRNLMDLLQNQFNLSRSDFFLTSDEELTYGGDWVEQIRKGMEECKIILPFITPNYLQSQFCLCELGATWVNKQAIIPVVVPPLDYRALAETPYRTNLQTITLSNIEDLNKLAQAIVDRGLNSPNMVRFGTRAKELYEDKLLPFIKATEELKPLTDADFDTLKTELATYKEAYLEMEVELEDFRKQNEQLRKMKDAEEVKEMDYAEMSEWDTFMEKVESVKTKLDSLPALVVSIIYNARRPGYDGFTSNEDRSELNAHESDGYIKWETGWEPDYEHPIISKADDALDQLAAFIGDIGPAIEERFEAEYDSVRMNLIYRPFWEKVLEQRIQIST